MIKRFETNGSLQSIDPPETAFGYSYWSQMIPPFKPESVLILGAGKGTIEKLIRKVWGDDFLIERWDINTPELVIPGTYTVDAHKYVCNTQRNHDYTVVDISEGSEIPDWLFSEYFVKHLARITKKLLSINVLGEAKDMNFYDTYFDFELEKTILDNKIYFYKAKDNKETYFL